MRKPNNRRPQQAHLTREQIIDLTGCPRCLAPLGRPCRDSTRPITTRATVHRDRQRRAVALTARGWPLAKRREALRFPGDERDYVPVSLIPPRRRAVVRAVDDETHRATLRNVRAAAEMAHLSASIRRSQR
jgi:hypothetical protein